MVDPVDSNRGASVADRDEGESAMVRRLYGCDEHMLVRREFGPPVSFAGNDEHRDRLDQRVREVENGRPGPNRRLILVS
jgi:hypothetical protein